MHGCAQVYPALRIHFYLELVSAGSMRSIPRPKMKTENSKAEHISIRVDPELKRKWDDLKEQGYDRREWLREILVLAFDELNPSKRQ